MNSSSLFYLSGATSSGRNGLGDGDISEDLTSLRDVILCISGLYVVEKRPPRLPKSAVSPMFASCTDNLCSASHSNLSAKVLRLNLRSASMNSLKRRKILI